MCIFHLSNIRYTALVSDKMGGVWMSTKDSYEWAQVNTGSFIKAFWDRFKDESPNFLKLSTGPENMGMGFKETRE